MLDGVESGGDDRRGVGEVVGRQARGGRGEGS